MGERVVLRQRLVLGGIGQEVQLRGADASNPLLLILHGGPGFAEMPLFTTYNSELEQHFLVVHWDQRGAGRSFADDIPGESMTLRQFVDDAVKLVDWLTEHFAQEKIFLLGHSWGSLLGATVAARNPEKLHAYIGAGQLVAGLRNEQASYAFTLRTAIEQHNDDARKELERIEARYTPTGGLAFADLVVQRGWLDKFGGTTHGGTSEIFGRVEAELREEYYGVLSAVAQEFSFGYLMSDLLGSDLLRTARTFDLPIHFLLGRHDQNTPAELAVEYFEAIEAPHKELHWFENSAHLMPFEEPAKFNALLIEHILHG